VAARGTGRHLAPELGEELLAICRRLGGDVGVEVALRVVELAERNARLEARFEHLRHEVLRTRVLLLEVRAGGAGGLTFRGGGAAGDQPAHPCRHPPQPATSTLLPTPIPN